MKKLLLTKLLSLALPVLFSALPAAALDLGDPAPAIAAAKWITGTETDPTKVDGSTFHLVEVWSVTCPPCVQTIPIINDVQKRYADQGLKVVSFTSDSEEDVRSFLEEHPMEYSSFIDKDGESTVNYMAADNRNTIPHAFLFDKSGALVWIGNPLDNLEDRVKGVISGKLNKEFALAVRAAREGLQTSLQEQDIDGMLTHLDKLEELEPANYQYYQAHYQVLTEFGAGDPEDVKALLARWHGGVRDQPEGLIMLSMVAFEGGHPTMRDPELGLAAAKRAAELDSPGKLQAGLALSNAYKEVGRLDLAVKAIQDVRPLAADPAQTEILTAIEDFYRTLQEVGEKE